MSPKCSIEILIYLVSGNLDRYLDVRVAWSAASVALGSWFSKRACTATKYELHGRRHGCTTVSAVKNDT